MGQPGNICTICGANYRADVLFCPQDGAPLGATAPKAGDPLLGLELPSQIRIEKLIGVGAAGRVYRGFQGGIERPVAIKVLHAELSGDSTVVARFLREGRVASLLAHPHVVEIFVTGQLPPGGPGGGSLYIVMEHLDGISLRSALAARGGTLPLPRALRIVLQLCDAVGEAHGRGIVHRDIKPENVMLVRRGNDADFVKVLDFGMARMPAGSGPVLTKAGLIFGTARYISPEGAAGQPVGPPADVYAIATVLYQVLAGSTPFEGETAVEVLARQINEAPAPLRSHPRGSYVPEPIAAVIAKNLGKKPDDRCVDARGLARSLLDAARAAGLAPEALVGRSALLGEPAHEHAFVSAEPTRQLEYGGDMARRVEAPATVRSRVSEPAPSGSPSKAGPSSPAHSATRSTLTFLLGCVAGGVALAAVGVKLRAQGGGDDESARIADIAHRTEGRSDAGAMFTDGGASAATTAR